MKRTAIIKTLLMMHFWPACFIQKIFSQISSNPVKITWVGNLNDDFSFSKKWSYPEGVYKNKHGQISCDGLCPGGTEKMIDRNGRIYKDSLKAFYQLVDTTHIPYSIECDAWCYEWAGTDFIDVYHKTSDTVFASTWTNAATHCSLEFAITGDSCIAIIDLISIVSGGNSKYHCRNGDITIDKNLWRQGILKARFSFNFDHPENPKRPIYWKGKIYSKINSL